MKPLLTCVLGTYIAVFGALTGCATGPRARPLQSGQTSCYEPNSNSIVGCVGTGQDGELQAGVARRYVDNGDGTITDVRTGLMWEKKCADGSIHDQEKEYSWIDAFAVFIVGLNRARFAGHTDWRLPNVNELHTLVDYGQMASPTIAPVFNRACATGCTVLTCSCTSQAYSHSYYYWSSTTITDNPEDAFGVSFVGGYVGGHDKSDTLYVRAVRGGL